MLIGGSGRAFARHLAWFFILALAAPGAVTAQVLERHVAPGAPPPPDEKALTPAAPTVSDDNRVLAPALTGVVLIGAQGGETAWPQKAAIEDQGAGALDLPALQQSLRPYLGKPLTLKLVTEIQAVVIKHYRARNRPFVAVAPPPQEVSHGVLRMRVIEFRLGAKTVKAKSAGEKAYVSKDIRLQTGQTIDARLLSQDLDWIAHSPFQQVTAQFAPGAAVGDTDMTLTETPQRKWRLFSDYSNSGARVSGYDRYAVGAQAALPGVRGGFISYQLTGSQDAFIRNGDYMPLGDARYVSHSLVATVPVAPRQDLTLALGYITSYSPSPQGVDVRQATTEASLTYRFALSNLIPALRGDLSIGGELRRQERESLFGGEEAAKGGEDIAQGVLGYSLALTDGPVRQAFSVQAHYSPGSADDQNQSAALARYSNGRVTHSQYVYVAGTYSIAAPLGHGWAYQSNLNAQIAQHALSDTESLVVGGTGAVRGYTLDDGAFDQGVIWSNELHAPAQQTFFFAPAALGPYVFADLGYANDLNHGDHTNIASAGLGADAQWGPVMSAGVTAAYAFDDGPQTHAGTVRFQFHISARY